MTKNKYEEILLVSTKLISQQGFKGASLQKIANGVGLHKSSLFHYFKSKDELLLRILKKSIEEVNKNLETIITNKQLDPKEKLKNAINNHLSLLIEYIDNVNIYLNEFKSLPKRNQTIYLEKRKKYENNFEKIIVEMKKKGFFNGLDAKLVTFGVLGMLNWTVKWYKNDGRFNVREISDIYNKMITQKSIS